MEASMSANLPGAATAALEALDPIWTSLRKEAEDMVAREPALAGLAYTYVLNHERLEHAVAQRIADRLDSQALDGGLIGRAFEEMWQSERDYSVALRADLVAVYDRDPACTRFIEPVLYFKGFHAIQTHRLAHWLYGDGRRDFAYYLQSRASEVFQVDINPAVPMGRGIFIDHATGVVIGATAVIEDDVSILQNVTLGGTGKERGDRHPSGRADRRRRQDPRQYRGRPLLARRRRVGGAAGGAGERHRRRRSGQGGRARRLRRAVAQHGSSAARVVRGGDLNGPPCSPRVVVLRPACEKAPSEQRSQREDR
jgi:serine O-acetyltransferase